MQTAELNVHFGFSKLIAAGLLVCGLATSASALDGPYTREQLQMLSKDELIGIVLYLQGGQNGNCERFELGGSKVGSIIKRVNHPGFNNDGTLLWPNGNKFMVRNSGFNNDRQLNYPNGNTLRVANSGFNNHNQINWPNGNAMRVANSGFNNDGSIRHADGSNWLLRNRGFSNDRQRSGSPTDQFDGEGFSVAARLTSDDAVYAVTTISDQNWSVRVYTTASAVDRAQDEIFYEECF